MTTKKFCAMMFFNILFAANVGFVAVRLQNGESAMFSSTSAAFLLTTCIFIMIVCITDDGKDT